LPDPSQAPQFKFIAGKIEDPEDLKRGLSPIHISILQDEHLLETPYKLYESADDSDCVEQLVP
jgi:hypothetical protein